MAQASIRGACGFVLVAYPSVTSDEPQGWQNFIAVRRRITMQQNVRLVAA
jgi:hypothetical protein